MLMNKIGILILVIALGACNLAPTGFSASADSQHNLPVTPSSHSYPSGSWQHFLQHLPAKEGPVLDYSGNPVSNQQKHVAIVPYDVGTKDLQQCADALIRLRAEYLFSAGRYEEIGFHFTSGHLYRWKDYCKGLRPVIRGNSVAFSRLAAPGRQDHPSLRRYLDIVYTYAGTVSLARELQPTRELKTGTVIITPGSPGHCSMIVDEATDGKGKKLFKLVEGFMPAQSIYILKNPATENAPWYALEAGAPVETSSYSFHHYKLGRFE
ncbi:DUF4846 domain-containing protein [Paraflavisolibacter sp. H34]|uniref:DUF4846 domain-containing protein n=1 Tax=Huijunlia imazamoxiresistens TaxID=3127457 RepID=UPI0030195B85